MTTFLAAGAVGARIPANPAAAPQPGDAAHQLADATARAAQLSRVALSMYADLPDGEIAIEEFERFAMDRLRGG